MRENMDSEKEGHTTFTTATGETETMRETTEKDASLARIQ